jgi:hypothetical protein
MTTLAHRRYGTILDSAAPIGELTDDYQLGWPEPSRCGNAPTDHWEIRNQSINRSIVDKKSNDDVQ